MRALPSRKTVASSLISVPITARRPRPGHRVAIIGAGLAGLCAAYELRRRKYEVVVYEARDRIGGRVDSLDDFDDGKVVEGGGELIGSNHPLWNKYRQDFSLHFTNTDDYANSPVRIGGRTLTFDESAALLEGMDRYFRELNSLAKKHVRNALTPWTTRNAPRLDRQSLEDWRRSHHPRSRAGREALSAVVEQLVVDNGRDARDQSLLGVLAMIKGHGLQRYWTDTELYRCSRGNWQLAKAFKKRLGPGTVKLNCAVTGIRRVGRRLRVSFKKDGATRGRRATSTSRLVDDVILTVPPAAWKRITFGGETLRKIVSDAPELGRNVKYLMSFNRRFWEDFASSPTLTDEGPVDLTWETTEADPRGKFTMVAFSGADHARRLAGVDPRRRDGVYRRQLEIPYPGIGKATKRRRFMNWPGEKWTGGSYYFPAPGEVRKWGPIWDREHDGLHFAGEHTCFAFMGYMEGALHSGYLTARRLARRDGLL